MKTLLVSTALGLGFLLSAGAYAQAPAGATAQCKDGTYYSGTTHKGACRGHEGVKEWLNGESSVASSPASATKAELAAKKSKAPAKSEAVAPATAAAAAAGPAPAGATALCKDGTYFSGTTHSGACRGHKGVKEWINGASSVASSPASATEAEPVAKKSKQPAKSEAAAPAVAAAGPAPAGATAQCKDGTYYSGTTHSGACRGHKGVKEWIKAGKAEAASPAATPKPSATPVAAAPAAAAAKSAAVSKHAAPTPASQIAQKPGGGPGLVWVNATSKVYHCQSDPWYGKTKEGSYMSEAAAKAAGDHPSHGKDCG